MNYSITIPTYVYRFEKYFKKLITDLSKQKPDITKIIFVNGQFDEKFHENYRRDIQKFCADLPNVYLIMSPIFRGCAFMWNTCINFTNTEFILNLNDDILIKNNFLNEFEEILSKHTESHGNESFKLNRVWCHVCLSRSDILNKVGYFDERFIGLGDEDSDWSLRFKEAYGYELKNYFASELITNIDFECNVSKGMKTHGGKYSQFNHNFMFGTKYKRDYYLTSDGEITDKVYKRETYSDLDYYPAEKWYRTNYERM